MKLKLIPALASILFLAGCGEQPPAEKPPEARATPKLVPNAPEPQAHGPGDGHNHGPGDGHNHGPGDGHDHGPGDGHDHGPGDGHNHGPGDGHDHGPAASPSPAASAKATQIPMHGYSPDGKPSK